MRARVYITPKEGILDPQGQAIERSLHSLGFAEASNVRLGRFIELALDESDRARAEQRLDVMCRQLLANGVLPARARRHLVAAAPRRPPLNWNRVRSCRLSFVGGSRDPSAQAQWPTTSQPGRVPKVSA